MVLGMNRGQEEKSGDGKPFSTWCLKLRELGASAAHVLDGSRSKTGVASY